MIQMFENPQSATVTTVFISAVFILKASQRPQQNFRMHLGMRKCSWICSLYNHQRLSLDPVYATTSGQELQICVSANWAPDPTVFSIGG